MTTAMICKTIHARFDCGNARPTQSASQYARKNGKGVSDCVDLINADRKATMAKTQHVSIAASKAMRNSLRKLKVKNPKLKVVFEFITFTFLLCTFSLSHDDAFQLTFLRHPIFVQ